MFALAICVLVSCGAPAANTPVATGTPDGPTLNVVKAAELRETVRIEILEMGALPSVTTRQQTITDGQVITRLITSLDGDLPLRARVGCVFIYKLTFRLRDGRVQEFGYSCGETAQILRGGQDFWQDKDITAPQAFQQILKELLK
jgi:hypothetical protein